MKAGLKVKTNRPASDLRLKEPFRLLTLQDLPDCVNHVGSGNLSTNRSARLTRVRAGFLYLP